MLISEPVVIKQHEFNSMGFRILFTDFVTKADSTVAQFIYKGYEVSFCQSLIFDQILVAVQKDNKVISHHFSVQSAIEAIDKQVRGY